VGGLSDTIKNYFGEQRASPAGVSLSTHQQRARAAAQLNQKKKKKEGYTTHHHHLL
jgi:hypothetical protein